MSLTLADHVGQVHREWTEKIVVGSCAIVSPGGLVMREYGRMPVTSPLAPLHHLVRAAAAIDEDGDASGQHDEQPGSNGVPFRGEDVAGLRCRSTPWAASQVELLARRSAQRLVRGQPIDEIG